MNRRLVFLLIGTLLPAFSLWAFVANFNDVGQPQAWFKPPFSQTISPNVVSLSNHTIRYYLAEDAFSAEHAEAELNAVRAAFDQWEAIPGSNLHFEEAGLVPAGVDANLEDDRNVVFWAKDSTLVYGGTADIKFALGLTFRSFFQDNTLAEADIVFNGVDRKWFAALEDEESTALSVEAIALHEIGHMIGMDHAVLGSSTMMFQANSGLNSQLGLSVDDRFFVQTYYPAKKFLSDKGSVRGHVLKEGVGIRGAAVVLEDLEGHLITGTLSRRASDGWDEGFYEMTALPPGEYRMRVTPLDPVEDGNALLRGVDINSTTLQDAPTDYLPAVVGSVTVSSGGAVVQDITVLTGQAPFRIQGIQSKTGDLARFTLARSTTQLIQGDEGVFIGVYGENFPSSDAILTVTGSGLTYGLTQFRENIFGDLDLWVVQVTVAPDATPGPRSFVLSHGDEVAYANGFVEVLPTVVDDNFDGLDDAFQRQYFPRFTAVEAGPTQDPDGDGFDNVTESSGGSDPTLSTSTPLTQVPPFAVLNVVFTLDGSQVSFESRPGSKYQLFSRQDIEGDPWVVRGDPVVAEGVVTSILDATTQDNHRFYRVTTVP